MSLPNMNKRYLQLNPVNAISSGDYSPSSGLPLIKFDISSTERSTMLDLSSLRINGKVTYFTGTVGTEAQVGGLLNNFRDGFAGDFHNCIDHVTVSSKRLNSVLERVTNYSRIIPSIVSGQHGENDINCELFHEGSHLTNNFLARNCVVAQENSLGKSFSSPLYCGMFQSGKDIDISVNGCGGLTIEILLKPAVSVCFGSDAATNAGGGATGTAQYKLSDLTLTVPAYEMQQPVEQSQFEFNSITSIFQTLNSSASVVALTPGLSRVSSVFMNALNTNELGNQNNNSCRLSNLGQLQELRFTKNGLLYPNQYRLFNDEVSNNLIVGANRTSVQGRAMVDSNYFEALSTNPIGRFGRTMLSYNTFSSGITGRGQTQNAAGNNKGTCSGQGILYDAYGSGENFSQTVWSCEFDNSTLDGTVATTLGLYIFFLNKQVLMMSPQGISVQR